MPIFSNKDVELSSGNISISFWAKTGPASILGAIFIKDIPLTLSPFQMALWIGAPPLYFGSKEP